jgi:hypothetical protein
MGLQNRIAEGGFTLPVAAAYGIAIWLLYGLLTLSLWAQLACTIASVYILVELSNTNALLRVRSRMVSSTFIVLSCLACFLFTSPASCIIQLCFVAAFFFLFHAYQDSHAAGRAYYSFVCIGVASLLSVHILVFVPILWILMGTQIQCLSLRTWTGSLLGLVTPYWFGLLWLVFNQDMTPLSDHFSQLFNLHWAGYGFSLPQVCSILFIVLLCVCGIGHFWQYSFEDKIRIRLLFGFFTVMSGAAFLMVAIQPHLYNVFLPIAILSASPLIAHLFTFTRSRLSNILFIVALIAAVALTLFNIISK